MKTVTVCNEKHSGDHPVTMRQLMSPHQRRVTESPPATSSSDTFPPASPANLMTPARTTAAVDVSDRASATGLSVPAVVPPPVSPVPVASTPVSSAVLTINPKNPRQTMDTSAAASSSLAQSVISPTSEDNLLEANLALRKEIVELKSQISDILDHTIESDRRLLQYTNEVFAVNTSSPVRVTVPVPPTGVHRQTQTETTPGPAVITTNRAVQTTSGGSEEERKRDLIEANLKIEELKDEVTALKRPCTTCAILKEEAKNMIHTIRILENQLHSQQDVANSTSNCIAELLPPVPVKNCFSGQVFEEEENEPENNNFTLVKIGKKSKERNKIRKVKNITVNKGQSLRRAIERRQARGERLHKVPFKNITISGDSHARHLAGLLSERLHPGTTVWGLSKPGAGLLTVASPSSAIPPPDHCHILIAGTNDVANGREDSIFQNMENIIKLYSATSKLLVSTLPHRYDLHPTSPVNKTIQLVNSYIAELCERYEGVELLEFGKIGRLEYTAHGMHLKMKGKRSLVRMMAERLVGFATSASCPRPDLERPSKRETTSAGPGTARAPGTFQLITYAEAVKQCPVTDELRDVSSMESSASFLGQRPLVSSLG